MEEIHKYFGPIQNNNSYNNVFSEDPKLIAKVEGLWMVIHKKPYFLLPKYILGMTKGLIMEMKGRKINWAMYPMDELRATIIEGFCGRFVE
jgi:hypothetical protein